MAFRAACLTLIYLPYAKCYQLPQPNIAVTYQIWRKNISTVSKEVFEEEGLPISTETQQRLPTIATHRVVFSNRKGKCAQSTRQCGNDPAGFLEAHIPNRGSPAWILLVIVS